MAASLPSSARTTDPNLTFGYNGRPHSFSHLAALSLSSSAEKCQPQPDLSELCKAVADGAVDRGVVPVENTHSGTFQQTLDALFSSGLYVVGEHIAADRHVLCGLPGSKLEAGSIKTVHSHGHVLDQARDWISSTLGGEVTLVVHDDTAGACEAVAASKDATAACIASMSAAEASGFSERSPIPFASGEPVTRYFVLSRSPLDQGEFGAGVASKTTVSCVLKNQPGALFRALSCFALRQLNVSKIEMVPRARSDRGASQSSVRAFEYATFVDVESGESSEHNLVSALRNLEEYCTSCKVLGTYPRFSPAVSGTSGSMYGV